MKFKKLNIIQLKHTSEMGQPSQVHFQQNDLRNSYENTILNHQLPKPKEKEGKDKISYD
jgi:hypothetical protein